MASSRPRLLALVRQHLPDLVVVDIRMPPTHSTEGLEAAQLIRQELPEVGILVLSALVAVEHAMALLASGRRVGYLLKRRVTDVDDFIDTLEPILRGGSVVDPRWCRSWWRCTATTTRSLCCRPTNARSWR